GHNLVISAQGGSEPCVRRVDRAGRHIEWVGLLDDLDYRQAGCVGHLTLVWPRALLLREIARRVWPVHRSFDFRPPLLRQLFRLGNLLRGHLFGEGIPPRRSLICSSRCPKDIPHVGLHIVFLYTVSTLVHETKSSLREGIALLRGQTIPIHSFLEILLNTPPIIIEDPQVHLSIRLSLGCGFLVPLPRLVVVLWCSLADVVEQAEVVLCQGISLLGQRLPFTQGSCVIAAVMRLHACFEVCSRRCSQTNA